VQLAQNDGVESDQAKPEPDFPPAQATPEPDLGSPFSRHEQEQAGPEPDTLPPQGNPEPDTPPVRK